MAKLEIKGLEEYELMISRIEGDSEKIIKKAVYAGADIVADAIKVEIKTLPIANGRGTEKNQINGITAKQKADLIDGFGLAKMEDRGGYIHTKAGFDGCGSTPSKKYPKGLPNALLARSLESGTSFRKKNAFCRRATNKVRKQAQQEMGKLIDVEIEALSK